jgi:hypothetical protein
MGSARLETLLQQAAARSEGLGLKGGSRLAAGEICQTRHQFAEPPVVIQADGTVADTSDDAINIHQYASGLQLMVQNITAQTLVYPQASTSGLDYSGDSADDAGFAIAMRQHTYKGQLNKNYFTVGTSPAFYFSLKFSIADVTDTDDCIVGFRKVEAVQDGIDDYDEMAGLNVISGNITIETIINGATTVSTDTTDNWADGETHTLKVLVSAAGAVSYQIDGVTPSALPATAISFDDGENVTPFFQFLHAGATAPGIVLIEWESGLQSDS